MISGDSEVQVKLASNTVLSVGPCIVPRSLGTCQVNKMYCDWQFIFTLIILTNYTFPFCSWAVCRLLISNPSGSIYKRCKKQFLDTLSSFCSFSLFSWLSTVWLIFSNQSRYLVVCLLLIVACLDLWWIQAFPFLVSSQNQGILEKILHKNEILLTCPPVLFMFILRQWPHFHGTDSNKRTCHNITIFLITFPISYSSSLTFVWRCC